MPLLVGTRSMETSLGNMKFVSDFHLSVLLVNLRGFLITVFEADVIDKNMFVIK